MNYRTMASTGNKLSVLGYGCMRFPRKGAVIDEERTRQQVLSAIEGGVNYFDTAYLYPGSEKVLGKILAGGLREKVKLATKLPHMLVRTRNDIETIFEKQLSSLQTDYIDYYLIHNVASFADWQRMKDLGILDFIQQMKNSQRICHIGFSFHGNLQTFQQMVDDYSWEFCQIQYNYLDEDFQAGTKGLHYAAEKGLGIIVMEPLRGGTLGNKIPAPAEKVFRQAYPERNPAEWALRWVLSHPEVSVVLSGMNEEEHIQENLRIASDERGFEFDEKEEQCLKQVKRIFEEKIKVSCTGCAYCVPCPHGVDIPNCFSWYNSRSVHGGMAPIFHYIQATEGCSNGKPSRASLCKDCGLCVTRCPQAIPIPEKLKDVAAEMEKPYIRLPVRAALKVMSRFGK